MSAALEAENLTPPRMPEREALAVAIERRAERGAQLERARAKLTEIRRRSSDLLGQIGKSEADLEEARRREPAAKIAQILGEANDADAPLEVKAAQEAFDLLKADRANHKEAEKQLAERISDLETSVRFADAGVRQALDDVVWASPEARRFLDAFLGAIHKMRSLWVAYSQLPPSKSAAAQINAAMISLPASPEAEFWRDALATLAAEADAPLPGG